MKLMPIAAFVLAACMAPTASAAGVRLEDQTTDEVRAAIAGGTTTILIPIGGTEQNGPHMALGKHNARAAVLADRVARELGRTLVAPVIRYVPEGRISPPTAHMRFAGTISVSDAAFDGIVTGAAESFRQHGFTDIVLLGDSGDYQGQLRAIADRLNRRWAASKARVHYIAEYYRASTTGFRELIQAQGVKGPEVAAHAGIADTALLMATDPAGVRAGHPAAATARLGEMGATLVVEKTVAAVREAQARPR